MIYNDVYVVDSYIDVAFVMIVWKMNMFVELKYFVRYYLLRSLRSKAAKMATERSITEMGTMIATTWLEETENLALAPCTHSP